jgi:hypothetical protein
LVRTGSIILGQFSLQASDHGGSNLDLSVLPLGWEEHQLFP